MEFKSLEKFILVLIDKFNTIPKETNDCAVLALSLATRSKYDLVFDRCRELGRVDGRGTDEEIIYKVLIESGIRSRKIPTLSRVKTLRTLARVLPTEGKYLIWTTGHISYAEDGDILDPWYEDSLCRIQEVRKLYYR